MTLSSRADGTSAGSIRYPANSLELNPYILTGCPVETALEYCEGRLSHSIEDYPEGILIPVDKPLRWTSADLVRKIKFQLQKHFHTHKLKVGHAGTLDPMATGLLIVCVGRATKIAEALQAHEKEYLARIAFGATTASYDLEQPVDQFFPFEHITREGVDAALKGFIGEQEQVPPVFSAKMVGGLRAYEYARAGEAVELRTARITISSLELLDYRACGMAEGAQIETVEVSEAVRNVKNFHTAARCEVPGPEVLLRIRCSKGTYIRSLARDLGLAMNSGAYLTALRRVASGDFRLADEKL